MLNLSHFLSCARAQSKTLKTLPKFAFDETSNRYCGDDQLRMISMWAFDSDIGLGVLIVS